MGSQQQFCLRWNNHQVNMLNVFDQLLQNEAFVDVTLACDGLSLKAHKVVLSACSPYFQKLLMDNPCPHPIVILKDVNYADLKALVDFMYKGEVNVLQDQLQELLKTAEVLKIKGLSEVSPTSSSLDSSLSQKISNTNGKASTTESPQPIATVSAVTTSTTAATPNSSPPSKRKRMKQRQKSGSVSETEDNVLEIDGPPEVIESKVDVPQSSTGMEEASQSSQCNMNNGLCLPKEEDCDDGSDSVIPEQKVHEGFSQENDDMTTPSLDPPTLLGMADYSHPHQYNSSLPSGLSDLSGPSTSNTCTPKSSGPYPCHICSKLMRTRKTLKKHMMIHNPFREHFPCTLCPRVYQRKDKLNSHFRMKHSLTPEVTITFKKPVDEADAECYQKHQALFASHSASV